MTNGQRRHSSGQVGLSKQCQQHQHQEGSSHRQQQIKFMWLVETFSLAPIFPICELTERSEIANLGSLDWRRMLSLDNGARKKKQFHTSLESMYYCLCQECYCHSWWFIIINVINIYVLCTWAMVMLFCSLYLYLSYWAAQAIAFRLNHWML